MPAASSKMSMTESRTANCAKMGELLTVTEKAWNLQLMNFDGNTYGHGHAIVLLNSSAAAEECDQRDQNTHDDAQYGRR